MVEVIKSDQFLIWFQGLRDARARARIDARILRLAMGNSGDVRPVGSGVSEMRIDYGPGYRVYYIQQGTVIAVLLCGGDKSSQDKDIRNAIDLAAKWRN
jgi:putative addiction module killer protein